MNNAADEIVILSDALEALRLRTEELEQKLDTTAQPLAAASVALGGALDGIKALQFHVRDSNLGALSGRIEELRASVAEKIAAFSTQLVDADKRLESEQRQNVDGLRVELGAIGSAVAALSKKFDSELARIETDAKAEFSRIEQIKLQVGPEGRSLNPRGTFVDGETYNRLDVVSWLGSSYIAAVDGVTEKPSRNSNQWQVLASRGGGAGGVGDFASLAGVAQINQGGTGQTTRAAALNALLPSQTGATQYVLLTDGSGNVSWGAQPVAGLPSQTSNGGKLLTTDGTNASWSGAVTVSGSNATVAGTLTVNGGSADLGTGHGVKLYVNNAGAWANKELLVTGYDVLDYTQIKVPGNASNTASIKLNQNGLATFSGNILVSGTTASTSTSSGALVVSGGVGVAGAGYFGSTVDVSGSGPIGLKFTTSNNDAQVRLISTAAGGRSYSIGSGANAAGAGAGFYIYDETGDATALRIDSNRQVQVKATTASSSTTTGALVVSGGVGVAGAIHGGNNIRATGNLYAGDSSVSTGAVSIQIGDSRTGSGYAHLDFIGDTTYTDYGLRILRGNSGANATSFITHRGTGELQFITEEAASILLKTANTTALTLTSAQQVQVNATTASSSTSTGALVVSGGVGVAGAAYVGGNATVFGTAGITINNLNGSGNDSILTLTQSGVSNAFIKNTATTGDIAIGDGGGTYLRITKGVGVVSLLNTSASTSTSTGALVVSGGVGVAKEVYVGKTCKVGTGSDNEGYTNVFTNKAENTAGPFDITLPSDCVGVVFLNSYQSGVGRSFREIPFICFGGTVTLGTSRTTVLTSDPVTSVVAASGGKITVSLYSSNTNCYWGIYVNKA